MTSALLRSAIREEAECRGSEGRTLQRSGAKPPVLRLNRRSPSSIISWEVVRAAAHVNRVRYSSGESQPCVRSQALLVILLRAPVSGSPGTYQRKYLTHCTNSLNLHFLKCEILKALATLSWERKMAGDT